ncbi:DUF4435 domain-containing protein [Streptococcus entericus]|uniref:DUF4435 domain-containing protein n=1 Tax=Streptococcus entericus TaxID=155680 RepID=UPI0003733922|nr:AAA family ATPase [Streptococcus entericus]
MLERLMNCMLKTRDQINDISLYPSEPSSSLELMKREFTKYVNDVIKQVEASNLSHIIRKTDQLNSFFTDGSNINLELEYLIADFEYSGFPDSVEEIETFIQIISNAKSRYAKVIAIISFYQNIPLLNELIGDEQSIILVGKNGVGKSTLVNDLKRDKLHNLFCIPAQKYLYMTGSSSTRLSNIDQVQDLFVSQNLKVQGVFSYVGAEGDTYELFSKIIDFIVREHQSSKSDGEGTQISKLDEVNQIYSKIFDDIVFKTDSFSGQLNPRKEVSYHINSLSDGEKSALFYIICAVLAKEKTIFVIDEPETHMNMAICNKLWDLILETRKDCKFIFISHNSDFITSRLESRIMWCQKYKNIGEFELTSLDTNGIGIDNKLLIELVGSRKPILFCEGETNSLDYQLFNILYSDRYLIKPIKGHRDVIEAVKAVKKLGTVGSSVVGLIDRDFYSQDILDNYKEIGVYHLPVNEVEMLLMKEPIVEKVLSEAVKGATFEDVKNEVRKSISNKKERQAGAYVKYVIEGEFFRVSNLTNRLDISDAHTTISSNLQKMEQIFDERVSEIENLIDNDDYDKLISICNLKGEIVNGVMSKFENEYAKRALLKIKNSPDLQDYLRDLIALP